ncbi:MAG: MaoC family dehydratase N-terminal domain-containing protein [Blastomonas sp.]
MALVLTDEIRAMIGLTTGWQQAANAVEASEVRRFHHATMDCAPRYFDAGHAASSRYGALVAPPAFVVEMFRRPDAAPDPLDRFADDRNYDGAAQHFRGLPEIRTPLKRLLNGGYSYEFYRYARIGDQVERQSRFADIREKAGSAGPLLIILIETLYRTIEGTRLLRSVSTLIQR